MYHKSYLYEKNYIRQVPTHVKLKNLNFEILLRETEQREHHLNSSTPYNWNLTESWVVKLDCYLKAQTVYCTSNILHNVRANFMKIRKLYFQHRWHCVRSTRTWKIITRCYYNVYLYRCWGDHSSMITNVANYQEKCRFDSPFPLTTCRALPT